MSDEINKLFNMAINAKEIAVKTADEALEFADNSDIATEANKLLDRYRAKFKEDIHRLILKERREALKELQGGYMHRVVDNWKSSISVGGGFRPITPAEIYRDVQTHYENLIEGHISALDAEIEGSNHG